MYIRRNPSKKNNVEYFQLQLCESVRTAMGPRTNIILNLGTVDIHKEYWKPLALAIEAKLNKQLPLIEYDEYIDSLANQLRKYHYSKQNKSIP